MILPLHIAAGNFFSCIIFSCCQFFFHVAKTSCDKKPPHKYFKETLSNDKSSIFGDK